MPIDVARGVSIKNIEADDIEEKPLDFAKTCAKCNDVIVGKIREWNYTRDIQVINELSNYPCNCFVEWKESQFNKTSKETIEERTSSAYFKIKEELRI